MTMQILLDVYLVYIVNNGYADPVQEKKRMIRTSIMPVASKL